MDYCDVIYVKTLDFSELNLMLILLDLFLYIYNHLFGLRTKA